MGDAAAFRLWAYRGLYLLVVFAIAVFLLLPFGGGADRLPGPDVILALTLAWAMRRADHLPIIGVGAAMLVADLLLMRPPGLMAALIVLAVEAIRAREYQWRDLPLPLEWLIGAALTTGVLAVNALLLTIFLVPQPTLGQLLIRMILTAAAYPLAAFVVRFAFGVTRRAAEGDLGGRT